MVQLLMTKIITIELLDEDNFAGNIDRDLLDAVAEQVMELAKVVGIEYAGISVQIGSPDDPRTDYPGR